MENAMNLIRTLGACATAATLAIFGSPAAADAAADTQSTSTHAALSVADGYLYAWTEPYRRGGQCRWLGNAETWGGCANNVGSVENRGYAAVLDDVNLYWGAFYAGAWACLGRGDMWLDLSIKREHFNHGTWGNGQPLYNNIASHRWVGHC
jgi:hypothetical protein